MPHSKQALKKQIQKTHTACRRCGRTSFHIQKKVCSACGYPAARNRHYNWGKKMIRREEPRHRPHALREGPAPRRAKNGFREKTAAPSKKKAAPASRRFAAAASRRRGAARGAT